MLRSFAYIPNGEFQQELVGLQVHPSCTYVFLPLPQSTQALCWAPRRREETHDSRYRKHCTAEQRSQRGGCRAAGGPGDITDLGEQVGLGQRKHLCRSTKWGSITHPGVNGGQWKEGWCLPLMGCCKKKEIPETGWQQKCISHIFKAWEVQGHGTSRFRVWWGPFAGLQKAYCVLMAWSLGPLLQNSAAFIARLCSHPANATH